MDHTLDFRDWPINFINQFERHVEPFSSFSPFVVTPSSGFHQA